MKKKIFEQFKTLAQDNEFTKQEGTFSLVLFAGCFAALYPPFSNKYYDFDFGPMVFFQKDKHGLVLFSLDNYIRTTNDCYRRYLRQGKKVQEIQDFYADWKQANQAYADYSPEKISLMADQEIRKKIQVVYKIYHQVVAATVFSESLDEEQVKNYFLEVGGGRNNSAQFVKDISKPTFESFALRIDKGLVSKENNPYKLQYLFTDYFLAPSLIAISKKIKEELLRRGGQKKIMQEVSQISRDIDRNKKKIQLLRNGKYKRFKNLIDFVGLSMEIRDVRKEPMHKLLTVATNLAREILERKKINERYLPYVLDDDFKNNRDRRADYGQLLRKRREKGVVAFYSKEGIIFEFGNVQQQRKKFFALMDGKNKGGTIKGTIGCKGKVKAMAQVILNENDFKKFKEGSILVTSMTRPEFVPLMKKSAAIVTDEGGLTCHAAIVSRELKIPCIIGTKNATRVIKEGTLVEVDAEQGVVKF